MPSTRVHADITGYQGDASNAGWNSTQPDLLPTEVSDTHFGLRYDRTVSGQVFAQPVIADDGTGRRVMVIATENNNVYAVSPDSPTLAPYWSLGSTSLGSAWVIAKNSKTVNCTDITPNIGVTSTPVIDPATHTAYLTAKSTDTGDSTGATGKYQLHALSLTDGSERAGFPVTISGNADNDSTIAFNPTLELQRPGLLLLNGVVYMGFGGHCDTPTYYGWVIGVGAYNNANAGVITARWADQKASDGFGGGIWAAGSQLTSDGSGQILLTTGNGTVPEANPSATTIPGNTPPNNLGESVVRLTVQSTGKLKPTDFFSPSDNKTLNATDLDLGATGVALLPASFGSSQHPHVGVSAGKVPTLRSYDLSNLGGYDSATNHVMGEVNYGVNGGTSGTWGRPAAWPGDGGWVYIVAMADPVAAGSQRLSGLVALQRSVDGSGNVQFVVKGTDPAADADWIQTSGSPTITSNGTSPLTAVVWAFQAYGHNSGQSRLMGFGPVPDASGNLPLLFTGPSVTRGGKFVSIAADGNHLYFGTRDDTINTGGTSHVYGYWLSQVPDVAETPYWFGNTAIGNGSTITQTLAVRAGSAVSISSVTPNDSHFTVGTLSPAAGTSMAPGSTVQIPITFTPTATGDVRSTVSLSMSDGTTVKIGVGGTGFTAPAQLTASPTNLPFGNHATGTSTQQSFSLTNTGGQSLTIGSSSTTGNAAFAVSGLPAGGTVIKPGDPAIPVTVTYAPTTATPSGSTDTGSVTVNSSANQVIVTFNGTATPPGQLTVTPLQLDAGNVQVGTDSAPMHFTVSNTGGTTLTISRSKPPGGDFIPQEQLPEASTLAPGQSKGIDVIFHPTVTGPQSQVWSLNSDAPPQTEQHVTFTGNGVAPPGVLAVSPLQLPAGNVQVGQSSGKLHFTVSNTAAAGSKNVTITTSTPPSGDFKPQQTLPAGTTIAPGSSVGIDVVFTPSTTGQQTATWVINSDSGGPFTVNFSGNGTAPPPPPPPPPAPLPPPAPGYWLVGSDGGIFPFGGAVGYGSTGGMHLNQPIVGMAATPTGHGYWLVAADGGIFPFGDATGYGSTGNIRLNQPIVGMAATPTGHGYWLVASDGGIFPFGDATGYGSTGNIRLNQPIVGMARTRDGGGYWLVASDGGIFPFGDATGYGSTGNIRLNQPIVGMAATPDSGGYWLVARDGGIFPFGDATGYGSTGNMRLNQPIVGMAATSEGRGYWLVAADGGIFPFGDAQGLGSTGNVRLNRPIVGMASSS